MQYELYTASTLLWSALEHFLQTVIAVPSDFVRGYNSLILVLLQIGHVPRARDGSLHRERPLFDFDMADWPLFYLFPHYKIAGTTYNVVSNHEFVEKRHIEMGF